MSAKSWGCLTKPGIGRIAARPDRGLSGTLRLVEIRVGGNRRGPNDPLNKPTSRNGLWQIGGRKIFQRRQEVRQAFQPDMPARYNARRRHALGRRSASPLSSGALAACLHSRRPSTRFHPAPCTHGRHGNEKAFVRLESPTYFPDVSKTCIS